MVEHMQLESTTARPPGSAGAGLLVLMYTVASSVLTLSHEVAITESSRGRRRAFRKRTGFKTVLPAIRSHASNCRPWQQGRNCGDVCLATAQAAELALSSERASTGFLGSIVFMLEVAVGDPTVEHDGCK